jgi:hypothetical protein
MRTAIPIIPNYILEGPPTMRRVTTALPKAAKEELEAAFAASMMEYQAYNTALWPGGPGAAAPARIPP